ncbi:MAG TPA: hypothetical protein VF786_09245 [Terriglobales bacterium]
MIALFIVYQSVASAARAGGGIHYRSIAIALIQIVIFGGTYIRAMQMLVRVREVVGRTAFAGLHLAFAFLCCMALVLVERMVASNVALY